MAKKNETKPVPSKMGPRSKCTPELMEKIFTLVRMGMPPRRAAMACGVEERTHFYWMEWGERNKEENYISYCRGIKEAIPQGEANYLAKIGQAASTQWQAAAWMLERRFPEEYARVERPPPEEAHGQINEAVAERVSRALDRSTK